MTIIHDALDMGTPSPPTSLHPGYQIWDVTHSLAVDLKALYVTKKLIFYEVFVKLEVHRTHDLHPTVNVVTQKQQLVLLI